MEKPNNQTEIQFPSEKLGLGSDREANTPLKNGGVGNIQYGGVDDDVPLLDVANQNRCIQLFQRLRTLTIEPFIFSYLFAYVLLMSCLTNMIMDKGCRYHLNFVEEVCRNLSEYHEQKNAVEILGNNYSLYCKLVGLLAALTMVYIAPWSDKYGRKLPLFLACFGTILSDIGIILCTVYFESDLFYLVLSKIPENFFGGFICVLTIVFSHASEVSSEKTRTLKYTMVEAFFGVGISLGGLAGGMLYRYYGYLCVYLVALAMHTFCLLWVVLFVQETTGLDSTASWKDKISDLFVCENFTKGWTATMRPRANNGRLLLLLFFISMCFIVLTYESFAGIGFVFVHHIYNWDPASYNMVNTTFSLTQMALLLIIVPILLRKFKVSDYALGIIGISSMMFKNFFIGFAEYGVYVFYFGNACGNFSGLTSLSVRSGISKIADKDELGRLFSFLATCESIFPMVGTILITTVFNATIDIFPNIAYLMTVGGLIVPLATFIFAYIDQRIRKVPQVAIETKY